MIHEMKIRKRQFEKIRNGLKIIDLRYNSKKRRRVKSGDEIAFSLVGNPGEEILVRVVNVYWFGPVEELSDGQEIYGIAEIEIKFIWHTTSSSTK